VDLVLISQKNTLQLRILMRFVSSVRQASTKIVLPNQNNKIVASANCVLLTDEKIGIMLF